MIALVDVAVVVAATVTVAAKLDPYIQSSNRLKQISSITIVWKIIIAIGIIYCNLIKFCVDEDMDISTFFFLLISVISTSSQN